VAIKIIPKKILINNLDLAREIRILKSINHRFALARHHSLTASCNLALILLLLVMWKPRLHSSFRRDDSSRNALLAYFRYIVKLYDVFLTPEHLQLVMEACEGQELFDEICNRRTFTEDDVKDIVIKVQPDRFVW